MTENCYHCGKPAVSREHVPPKCLFPEKTDKDYRVNLITVPSCDLHNSVKSGDDQFMMVYFVALAQNMDHISLRPHIEKTIRTIIRTPHFISEYTDQFKIVAADGLNERRDIDWYASENLIEMQSNYERICSFFAAVARGILFHTRGVQWDGGILVMPHFLGTLITDDGTNLTECLSGQIGSEDLSGSNKDIFFYTDYAIGEIVRYSVDMCFYNEFKVTCDFLSKSKRTEIESKFGHIEFVRWTE